MIKLIGLKQCTKQCLKFGSTLPDLNYFNQPEMNINPKLALQLPVELTSPYQKINNKILTFVHHFESREVKNHDNKKMMISMVTPLNLPIDKTFEEPYLFGYQISIRILNQINLMSEDDFQLLYLFNAWLLADLYLERKVVDMSQDYFQNSPQEKFLFGMCKEDDDIEFDWDAMRSYLRIKQTLDHTQCEKASSLYQQHGDKISSMGIYFGIKNPLINYQINAVILKPNSVPAIEFFKILVDVYKSFKNIDSALEYYKVTLQQLNSYTVEQFLLKFEFPVDESNKENIYRFRKYALMIDDNVYLHEPNEPLALINYTKHFKQCHGQDSVNFTYDYCEACDSKQKRCSSIKSAPLRNPQIYPLSQLRLCPIDIKFYDFFNSIITRFIDRLIQWIKAGQLKIQLNINSELHLIKDALCVSSVNPIHNYESLEVLGDSAMKYITSAYLFLHFLEAGEGIMTEYRTALIRNSYLKKIPIAKNIHLYMTGKKFYNKHMENFISQKNKQQLQEYQIVDSQLSDVYEALIGAVFQTTWSYKEVAIFMKTSNYALPSRKVIFKNGQEQLYNQLMDLHGGVVNYPEYFMDDKSMTNKSIIYPLPEYMISKKLTFQQKEQKLTIEEFQIQILDYTFRDINILREALTYQNQDNIISYQRLEFLGDAAMEALVITNIYNQLYKYYYQDETIMKRRRGLLAKDNFLCEGMLHQTKTILLDNGFMATMSLLHRFHEVVLYLPEQYKTQLDSHYEGLNTEDLTDYKMIKKQNHQLPKFYGDIWESVGAAVLLDGGWDAFMRVFGQMYKPFIKFVCQNVEEVYEYHQKENYACQLNKRIENQLKL